MVESNSHLLEKDGGFEVNAKRKGRLGSLIQARKMRHIFLRDVFKNLLTFFLKIFPQHREV